MQHSTIVGAHLLTLAWLTSVKHPWSQVWASLSSPDTLLGENEGSPWETFSTSLKKILERERTHDNDDVLQQERMQDRTTAAFDYHESRDAPEMTKGVMHDHDIAVMAIYLGDHDTHVAISKNGRLQCVLEFERLFDVRYTGGSIDISCSEKRGKHWCLENDDNAVQSNMELALRTIKHRCVIDDGAFPDHFDRVYIVGDDRLAHIVRRVFHVGRFIIHRHHWAHGLMAFHPSPFHSPLVISYDGSPGDEFHVYHVTNGTLQFVAHKRHKICEFYLAASTNLPLTEMENEINTKFSLGNPGKFMGYAGVGKPEVSVELIVHNILGRYLEGDVCNALKDLGRISRFQSRNHKRWDRSIKFERAVAASIQSAWEHTLVCLISRFLEAVGREHVDGIVLVGGGALNVMANQFVYDKFLASHQIGVYVPPAPADNGLAIGALLTDNASMQIPNDWQYIGFRLWDEEYLSDAAREWDAQQLSSIGGVGYLAELLAGGQPWLQQRKSNASRPIIAIVRGRQEFGPRALGHRSLVAVPDSEIIRDRLNTLKYRAWWRPAAPMIADESLEQVFGRVVKSPYMTMAPRVRNEVRQKFPAIAHFDGTARHQSVGHHDEPWIHSLLMAVGKRTGLAALLNTSFNRKGRPIVNTVRESLAMLSEEKDLDYVLIEDFLFFKKA